MNAPREKTLTDFFNITEKDIQMSEIYPSLILNDLSEGQLIELKILSDMPERVMLKNNKYKSEELKINVMDTRTKIRYSLWLSSKSLRIGLYRIYEKYNTLKDIKIIITINSRNNRKFYNVIES